MALNLSATDLFAGAGGTSEGLRRAGWHIEAAANHWPVAVATHQLNHPETEHRCKDLSEVDWRTFPSTTLLSASPSCVWHARSGGRRRPPVEVERLRADPGAIDRATAFAVIEAAEVHRYPAIIVENVIDFTRWTLYEWWLNGLRALGYHVNPLVLDAAEYGHAQRRARLFIVATRDGLEVDLTAPVSAPVSASTILDADPGNPVHRRLYVSDQIDRIVDEEVPHLVTYRRNARAARADRHPLATITAGGNHHGIATVIAGVPHHRMLTNRECARAQGFADTYEFVGTGSEVKRQIGNAVPVGVAEFLGTRIADALSHDQIAA